MPRRISIPLSEYLKSPAQLELPVDEGHSLYILQSARVRFQGGGVLHHLVHGDDQEDEIELSKQSNGGVNTWRCVSQDTAGREGKTVNLPLSIKRAVPRLCYMSAD